MLTVRPRQIELQAVRYRKDDREGVELFTQYCYNFIGDDLVVDTVETKQVLHPGDWLVRGPTGRLTVFSDAEFLQTYEVLP